MTDLNLSRFGTLVSDVPCYVFYAASSWVYSSFDTDDMAFAGTLIWYQTYKQIHTHHTHGSIGWHINIY